MSCTSDCLVPTQGNRRQAHCPVCHRTFSGIRNFDLHRVPRGVCRSPQERNMTCKNGVWGYHGTFPQERIRW